MPENIYGEILPDRINLGSDVHIAYPPQLILTFESLTSPTLGDVTSKIRSHIIDCVKYKLNPEIILNFTIDSQEYERSDKFIQKFISLCEYISDVNSQVELITISIVVRGHFFFCMYPLLYTGVPIKITEHTWIEDLTGKNKPILFDKLQKFVQQTYNQVIPDDPVGLQLPKIIETLKKQNIVI